MSLSCNILPFASHNRLAFGIYHGGVSETPHELATGKPDVTQEVNQALDRLQGGKHFLVRTYLRFFGEADAGLANMPTVADLTRYALKGRKLDLVLSNWDRTGNLDRWSKFIENAIDRYAEYAQCLQIGEEPNLYAYPGDGRFDNTAEAVSLGVRLAKERLRQRRLPVTVGFNAVPCADPSGDGFWTELASKVDNEFVEALDYVGLNLYLDVVEGIVGSMENAVERALTDFRELALRKAGIPASVPIHICENGWPTGPNRYYTRQADVLEEVIRRIYHLRNQFNITYYGLYSLRDGDTGSPDLFRQFGVMRDDYSPKPAFETYRRLVQELGV